MRDMLVMRMTQNGAAAVCAARRVADKTGAAHGGIRVAALGSPALGTAVLALDMKHECPL
jgi:hypothetical protein